MKKLILVLLLLAVSTANFSQPTTTTTSSVKTNYLEKSKKQKKVARIMLYGGSACIAISFLIPNGEEIGSSILYTEYENSNIKSAFFLSGFLSTLISIPIFIASHRNKKKSMRLSFKNEPAPQLQKSSFITRSVPSFSLKISL